MSDTFTTLDGITVDDIPVKFVAGNVLTDPESLFPVPVDEAVQDWLDEHPEATTTVQDGSITYNKLSSDLGVIQVADNYEELLETKASSVLVLHNDSGYGNGGACMFEVRQGETIGGYTRTDGSVVFPAPNQSKIVESHVPTKAIADVATSYYDRSNLTYGNTATLFNETVGTEIDCSAYVCAVLQGIDYDHSRYSQTENTFGDYIGNNHIPSSDSGRSNCLLTWELAQWFAEQKQLYTLQAGDDSKMQFGDILFFTAGLYPNRYLGIDHCALVVQTFPDHTALILQAGSEGAPHMSHNINSVVKMSLIDLAHYVGTSIVAFARPTYGYAEDDATLVSTYKRYVGQTKQIIEGKVFLTQLFLNLPLKPRTLYSLNLKGDLADYAENKAYMLASINQEDTSQAINFIRWYQGEPAKRDGLLTICGVTPSSLGTNPKGVFVYVNGLTGATGSARIDHANLYEGYKVDDPEREAVELTSSIAGFTNESYIQGGNLFLKFAVPLGTLTGDIEIATLPTFMSSIPDTFFFEGFVGYVDTIPIRLSGGKLYAATTIERNAALRVSKKLEIF